MERLGRGCHPSTRRRKYQGSLGASLVNFLQSCSNCPILVHINVTNLLLCPLSQMCTVKRHDVYVYTGSGKGVSLNLKKIYCRKSAMLWLPPRPALSHRCLKRFGKFSFMSLWRLTPHSELIGNIGGDL